MTHPLLRVVCCYGAGVALGLWLGLTVVPALIVIAALLLAWVFWRKGRSVLLPLIWAVVGCLNLSVRDAILSTDDSRLVAPDHPVLATVRGRLAAPPRLAAFERDGESRFRSMAELELEDLEMEGGWRPASGRIALSAAGIAGPEFHRGRGIEVSGVLRTPKGPLAPGLFDYRRHLELRGIHHQLIADTVNEWRLIDAEFTKPPMTERFQRWARVTLARGLLPDDPATGLIQAMTLGWKTALTDEVQQPFMKSGTMHIFAISGLHVALIAGMLLTLLRLVRVPRGACGLVAIPALWFYVAATGWQSSAVRATVMMTIILGGWALRRPSNLVNSLAAAGLIILVIEPHQLFQASFQLSFAVVLALGLILPPLQERVLSRLQPDPLLPRELVPRWKRWLGEPLRWLALSAATSLVAWIGSMPLTAAYFHLFSPGTLLANLMLLPCAGAALASAVASLAFGAWWPWMSETFNHGAWFWMHVMMALSEAVANLPGSYCWVPSPWRAVLILYYGTMISLAFGFPGGAATRRFVTGAVALCAAMLLVQMFTLWNRASLTVLPLHGGMSVHIKPAQSFETVLVDCGNSNAFNAVLVPYVRAQGVNEIQGLWLTHGDTRHVGAAPLTLELLQPEELVVSPVSFRSPAYRRLLETGVPSGVALHRLAAEDQQGRLEVLYPPADLKANRADDGAMVLRVELPRCVVLLLSDLSLAGQRGLLEVASREQLRADVAVVGLPDNSEPLIPDLLEVVKPRLIIVADDERPPVRRAPEALLERLRASVPAVCSTRQTGAVRVTAWGRGWELTGPDGRAMAGNAARQEAMESRSGSPEKRD